MFRFTIRDVFWLTAIVAMGVVVWTNQRKTQIERASLEDAKRELDSRRASMDREWSYLEGTARKSEQLRANDLRLQRSQFLAQQVSEADVQGAIKRSAELGAPQPKPLPPGYGQMPNEQ